jgi:hypothetical protein
MELYERYYRKKGNLVFLLLILIVFSLILSGVHGNLLIILLESSKILTSLREFSLFHTLSNIPVYEGTLCVHEIELVVDAAQSLSNCSVVSNHTASALGLCNVSSRDLERRLGVDSALESGRTPVNELNSALILDSSHGGLDVRWSNISTVHETTRHELSVGGVALGKKRSGLSHDSSGQLSNRESLMECLSTRHKRSVSRDEHVETRVWNENSGEVIDVYVQGSLETKGSGQGRNNLSNESVKVLVRRTLNVEGSSAHVVKGLVIKIEGKVGVLKKGMSREYSIVRLYNSGGNLGRGSDGETHLGLTAEVNSKTLKKKRSKTGSGSSSGGVEDKESLKSGTVVTHLTDLVYDGVDDILSDGVVTTSVVIGSILLSTDDGLGVVEGSVVSGTDGVTYGWLKIDHYSTRDVLSVLGLAEEGVVRAVLLSNGFISRHGSIRGNTVLKAVELPAGVTDCETSLSDMNTQQFSSHDFYLDCVNFWTIYVLCEHWEIQLPIIVSGFYHIPTFIKRFSRPFFR